MTALSQHGRLLRLHTALGPERLVVHDATIWESIGPGNDPDLEPPPRLAHPAGGGEHEAAVGFCIEIVALAADRALDLSTLPASPALLEMQLPDGTQRPFHGLVSEAGWVGGDGGLAQVRLLLEPWLAWLRHTREAWVFHEADVVEIVEQVFTRQRPGWQPPAWRWDLAEAAALPRRGCCVQAHESDLAFVERLLLEEGLCHWFEHEADPQAPGLGRHRLVIADHAGAFATNPQPHVRLAPGGGGPGEDLLTSWSTRHRLGCTALRWASRDDRSTRLRPVTAGTQGSPGTPRLEGVDVAEGYAYPTREHGERRVRDRLDALAAAATRCHARGRWRQAAAGTSFTLCDHPRQRGQEAPRDRFVVTASWHRVHNDLPTGAPATRRADAGPGHRCELLARPAALAPRPLALDESGRPELRVVGSGDTAGPTSALVVGDGSPVTTDRDHRVQLQYAWQRGRHSALGLASPHGDNASAAARTGGWVRVATPVAGDDWGGVHPPRAGQEALLAFVGGRQDRALVLGVLYGTSADEAGVGTGGTTPPWRPEPAAGDPAPGPANDGRFAGWRSRRLQASGAAAGDGNQLVFDDSPGAERVELSSDAATTRLQLGRLRHQQDGRPLVPRGEGLDLRTAAWGALRAGAGLLLSAHARPGSQEAGQQLDAEETTARLQAAQTIAGQLGQEAAAHAAGPAPVPTLDALCTRLATAARAAPVAWTQPDLLLAAPGGVLLGCSGHRADAVDGSAERVAGRLQHLAGRDLGLVAGRGLQCFAAGHMAPGAAVLPTLCLHAAQGPVTLELAREARLQASGDVRLASSEDSLELAGAQGLVIEAGGATLHLGPQGVRLGASGAVVLGGAPVRFEAPGTAPP
ncbi:type VI secretion system Vgr family protein [Rubrivivax gelatinosus]|uniref:Type VI secretion system secreted protein VgrG n=1 Tax=Rubrivivax gelatinosus TaxID=28068 RepID=A0A4R2M6M6_RUBGE|nr:type VI secretion system tip protein TssI/VgrG [Rubrivivax gelatinosus]MBK1687557.1 hypothetical protein [Rubrivivax gelatinosus]TCP02929.1 type VI secretion system secreted protein VgrG [Rubrivivax gelatinosus]